MPEAPLTKFTLRVLIDSRAAGELQRQLEGVTRKLNGFPRADGRIQATLHRADFEEYKNSWRVIKRRRVYPR